MNIKDRDRSKLTVRDFREVDTGMEEGRKFKDFEYAWKNQGVRPDGTKMSFKDAMTSWEAPVFIPRVVNQIIQEPVEPTLIGLSLLQRLKFEQATWIDLTITGATGDNYDVAEEESYPRFRLQIDEGVQVAGRGKTGLALAFTDDAIRYMSYDIVTMHLRAAHRALARWKEEKILNMWWKLAGLNPSHDNATPANSVYGTTTGRGFDGAQNGTFAIDNLFEMYEVILSRGFKPDILLVHPLTWVNFLNDAELRDLAKQNGSPWYGGQWTGDPGMHDFPSLAGGLSITGNSNRVHPQAPIGGDNAGAALPNSPFPYNMNSAPVIPSFLGVPLRVLPTSFLPYNTATNTTSIIMADSSQMGFYIEDEPLTMVDWRDEEKDIWTIKMRERYILRERNRGLGMTMASNVTIGSNQIILPAQTVIHLANEVAAPTRNVAVP